MNLKLRLISLLILVILMLILAWQNNERIHFQFFFWGLSVDRFLLLFGTFVLGIISGLSLCGYWSHRGRKKD